MNRSPNSSGSGGIYTEIDDVGKEQLLSECKKAVRQLQEELEKQSNVSQQLLSEREKQLEEKEGCLSELMEQLHEAQVNDQNAKSRINELEEELNECRQMINILQEQQQQLSLQDNSNNQQITQQYNDLIYEYNKIERQNNQTQLLYNGLLKEQQLLQQQLITKNDACSYLQKVNQDLNKRQAIMQEFSQTFEQVNHQIQLTVQQRDHLAEENQRLRNEQEQKNKQQKGQDNKKQQQQLEAQQLLSDEEDKQNLSIQKLKQKNAALTKQVEELRIVNEQMSTKNQLLEKNNNYEKDFRDQPSQQQQLKNTYYEDIQFTQIQSQRKEQKNIGSISDIQQDGNNNRNSSNTISLPQNSNKMKVQSKDDENVEDIKVQFQQQIIQYQQELEKRNQEIKELTSSKQIQEKQLLQFQQHISLLNQQISSLSSYRQQLSPSQPDEQFKQRLALFQEELSNLSSNVKGVFSAEDSKLEILEKKFLEIQRRIEEKNEQLGEARYEKIKWENEVEKMKRNYELKEKEISECKSYMELQNVQLQEYIKQVQSLKEQLSGADYGITSEWTQYNRAHRERDEMKQKNSIKQEELNSLKEQIRQLKNDRSIEQALMLSMKNNMSKLEDKLYIISQKQQNQLTVHPTRNATFTKEQSDAQSFDQQYKNQAERQQSPTYPNMSCYISLNQTNPPKTMKYSPSSEGLKTNSYHNSQEKGRKDKNSSEQIQYSTTNTALMNSNNQMNDRHAQFINRFKKAVERLENKIELMHEQEEQIQKNP